jgi:hypothetical protein
MISDVHIAEATGPRPASCQVVGYVAPSVGFVLALPATNWNGKLIQLGCGGFCGSVEPGSTIPFDCDDPLRRGYACIVSDNGHRSSRGALWAYDNLPAEIDHAYRGVHVTALAAKAIVERFYGRAAQKSYFMGSSTGGRQGLIAAQRFPWDFDGIVAGVPSLSVAGIHMNLLWGNRVFTNAAGKPLLSLANLETLHQAVLAECDLNDGIKDGLIGDPRECLFDPAQITCGVGKQNGCLSPSQVEIVNRIYGGAVTSRGEPLYMPGALKGSERTWIDWFSTPFPGDPHFIRDFVREEFRYSAFHPDPGPTWQANSFDFDRDHTRLGVMESLYAAVNPDLRKFKAAGGKLIVFAGWSDAGGMPLHAVDYYETTERVMGGRDSTQDFFRLFAIPGMGHAYGEGAFVVDWLSYLEAWAEQSRPPNQLLSLHVKLDDLDLTKARDRVVLYRRMAYPMDPALIEFERPVYPYPTRTKYRGHGDPRNAASFEPATPEVDTRYTNASRD